MIPEVPVGAGQHADVGAETDQASARLQAPERLPERAAQARFVGQVLEEVARENRIERVVAEGPVCRAVLVQERDAGAEAAAARRVQIHAELAPRLNLVDELSPPAPELEDRAVDRDVPLAEAAREKRPDLPPISGAIGEAPFVLAFELRLLLGGRRLSRGFHAAGSRGVARRRVDPIRTSDTGRAIILRSPWHR